MIIILLALFLLTPQVIIANSNPEISLQYHQDYLYQQNLYLISYNDYLTKKRTDDNFNTLATESEKNTSIKNLFTIRNRTLKSYLMAQRVDLDEFSSAFPIATTENQQQTKSLEDWLEQQAPIIDNLGNSQQIKEYAQIFKSKFSSIQKQAYSNLIRLEINRQQILVQKIENLKDSLNSKYPLLNLTVWQEEFSNKSHQIDSLFSQADNLVNQTNSSLSYSENYNQAVKYLDQSGGIIKQLFLDLKSLYMSFLNQ